VDWGDRTLAETGFHFHDPGYRPMCAVIAL
jgi:hypothetical protein